MSPVEVIIWLFGIVTGLCFGLAMGIFIGAWAWNRWAA